MWPFLIKLQSLLSRFVFLLFVGGGGRGGSLFVCLFACFLHWVLRMTIWSRRFSEGPVAMQPQHTAPTNTLQTSKPPEWLAPSFLCVWSKRWSEVIHHFTYNTFQQEKWTIFCSKQWILTKGNFPPGERCRHFVCQNWRWLLAFTGQRLGMPLNPTIFRTDPTTKDYRAQYINSATVEKLL